MTDLITVNRITKTGNIDQRQFNPGRPVGTGTLDDKWGVVEALKIITDTPEGLYHPASDRAPVSRALTIKLVDKGYVEPVDIKVTEGRGRAKRFYKLTGKGKSYLALSKNWKQ